ncbi:aminoglycoside phosphotransferase family protein [Mycobacterium manitobense]|uniref:Aminoglycoside phosphotransferase family protein n=1 Tax=[Mycobacterium] manitobense TaxID=190147 RepID=A0A9X2YRI0_9MYCO|nr:aminoglycoside phosphotransferase family protein [[Mycobacterium] manitobense]MCV7171342.1 aminoglycoside phosphotransferase family protein [[Mycobacterium] manitobense]
MHPDQLTIPVETVRALVAEQFPRWRHLRIEPVESGGTVNALFRLGDRLAARLPLEHGDVAAIRQRVEAESLAARELSGVTRFRTPEPVAIGGPGAGYPLPWSVQTWVPGAVAAGDDTAAMTALAADLAEFVDGVRTMDTRGRAFDGQGRGGDLTTHDEWMAQCFERSEALLDTSRLRPLWNHFRELPRHDGDVMTHGDLIPGNILVDGGRLAGVIDVGGLGPADPALDLVSAWHLFDRAAREVFRADLRCDDLQWERGRAWAFEQAMGLVWYYRDSNPAMSATGRLTLERILADEATA